MDLKTIILSEIREPWAIKKGFDTWDQFNYEGDAEVYMETDYFVHKEALDRLDKVMRWASLNGWLLRELKDDPRPWFKQYQSGENTWTTFVTDAELYELFKSQSE